MGHMTTRTTTNGERPPLTPEEIDKVIAEAERFKAEARKLTAEAEAAEHEAGIAAFKYAKAAEDEAIRVHSDDHARLYQFSGGVESSSVSSCMSRLRQWDRLYPDCDIEVIFNSPGGSVIPGMALFDLLVRLSERGGGTHKVTVGAQGYAASMAGILLQAGDVRWMGAQSYLMIHELSAMTGGKIGEMKDDVGFYDRICARVVDIFVARADGKTTKATFRKLWQRKDWWLFADEAIKRGFVDEVR